MKRTSPKRDSDLTRRLRLVRATIRELTPAQLDRVHGGTLEPIGGGNPTTCLIFYTRVESEE